ncbi:MAG TPA: UrcA family protein [Rhizomicrobium sp.]|jgi:UrcA family protein|nr:UrcA family protein [Rhizomicrobium sp.]
MWRPIVFLIPCLLTASAGMVQAEPRIVYTRHVLKLDVRDLDLTRPADVQALRTRIEDAADKVCIGRPDKDRHYSSEEQAVLLQAYEKCRADAVQHALASLPAPALTASLARTGP